MYAFVHRSGEIKIARRLPPPAEGKPLAKGTRYELETMVFSRARKGYADGVWLLPGIPEAENEAEALKALENFRVWIADRKTGNYDVLIEEAA